jgi:hypothetical protein
MNIQKRLDNIKNRFPKSKNIEGSCYKVIDEYGNERWYNKDHQLHRNNDLPAIIWSNGSKFWCKNGRYHRDNDLPAVIYSNGNKEWYQNGKQHRDNDQPVTIYSGTKK